MRCPLGRLCNFSMLFRKKPSNLKSKPQLISLEEPPEELAPYRIPFRIGESPVESARDYLKACRDQLKTLHESHFPSEQLVRLNTLYIDDLVLTLFERADWLFQESHFNKSRRCSLMALGGYGRSEMSLRSDIDLLFVYPDKPEEYLTALTDSILYVLWDSGLDVGSATRSIKDCRKLLREDVVSWTSMLDARYLAGDRDSAQEFLTMIQEETNAKGALERFTEAKLKENEERRKRYGGSVYILEPNIKESEGGLRDFQKLQWFSKVVLNTDKLEELAQGKILTEDSFRALMQARGFPVQVRSAIHFRAYKKNDQLTFQYQEEIARELGYQDEHGILAVERFMQAYYQHAANIKRITSLAISSLIETPDKKLKVIRSKKTAHLNEDFAVAGEKILVKNPDCF